MFRPALRLIAILTFLLVPYFSHAQQAEAPVYKDGDWWRVKVDMVRPAGVSVSGPVLERFPEYIDAFKLVMTMNAPQSARPKPGSRTEVRTHTYYYAPDVKAIASFDTAGSARVTSSLIDYSLAK